MYILDTNTLIYYFKGMGAVSERMLATSPSDIKIPSIVIYELEYGLARSNSPNKRRSQLRAITNACGIVDFTEETAKFAANIRVSLEKKGLPISPHDILIAASALQSNDTLITKNTKEFSRVDGLDLQDWF